ncbi:MAG: cytochrome c family protein [Alphaproteobacteria bacterium]|nr:cytochrome c family protein [Alphaproteobacteria bacterium]
MLRTLLAVAMIAAAPAMAFAEGDVKKGKKVFRKCKACHAVGEKAKHRVGPILNGIVGAKAGAGEGYKYSDAMTGSGLTWDEATLSEFLTKPKEKVPGTKMIFGGLKKEKQRNDLIAYLKTFKADGTAAE